MTTEGESPLHKTVEAEHWELSVKNVNQTVALVILMLVAGFFLFFGYIRMLDGKASLIEGWGGTPLGLALSLPAFILHEMMHGLGYWWVKAKPKYGFVMVAGTPALYTTSAGHWMTRSQYAIVAIIPIIGVNVIGLILMAFVPHIRYGLLMTLTMHFSGCAGDIFFLWKLLHLPKGTLFQDTMNGFDYRL